ncbi:MAG TPA: alkaline phosphatase family protein [Candidatus Eremiobacteraceae bacterium]|nr:alkaline phosphatase family protein [Candidatus Eremiobacteraceae bacterium]
MKRLLGVLLLAGCGASSTALPAPQHVHAISSVHRATTAFPIQHIIVIMQENRTPDNLFHCLVGKADIATTGTLHDGTVVPLTPTPLGTPKDLPHSRATYFVDYNSGGMNGFDLESSITYPKKTGGAGLNPYQYVQQSDVQPYCDMANQFAFADAFFGSSASESYIEHQYMIAGQSAMAYTNPEGMTREIWGCDSSPDTTTRILNPLNGKTLKKVFPCFDYQTIGDELDTAGITWTAYASAIGSGGGNFSEFDAIKHIRYGPDWVTHVSSPSSNILKDISSGNLKSYSIVTPTELCSDHAGSPKDICGPSWVSSIVNAVGGSSYWSSTAIFITWDEWGGWYDHAFTPMLDVMGPGFRVPLVVVSPYVVKAGFVSHKMHEFGSVLHFVEEDYGLPALTNVDSRADDLTDMFNFNLKPRPFKAIKAPMTAAQLLAMPDDRTNPDDDTGDQNY